MLRLDRLLTLYCFSPLRKLISSKDSAIPILMYHSISDSDEQGIHPYYRTCTSPRRFAEQISWLRGHGYTAIRLTEAVDLLSGKKTFPGLAEDKKYVVITFDDGLKDFYTDAFPVLKEHGFMATVFLPTAYVDGRLFNGRHCLDWVQINELHATGIVFGSHTHTHRQLSNLSRSAVAQELRRSKDIIENKLGSAVTDFSYPYRFPEESREFRELIGEELTEAGYASCVTTIIGRYRTGDASMLIKRLPVNSADDETFFDAKLKGNYDWLHTPQYMTKRARLRTYMNNE